MIFIFLETGQRRQGLHVQSIGSLDRGGAAYYPSLGKPGRYVLIERSRFIRAGRWL